MFFDEARLAKGADIAITVVDPLNDPILKSVIETTELKFGYLKSEPEALASALSIVHHSSTGLGSSAGSMMVDGSFPIVVAD